MHLSLSVSLRSELDCFGVHSRAGLVNLLLCLLHRSLPALSPLFLCVCLCVRARVFAVVVFPLRLSVCAAGSPPALVYLVLSPSLFLSLLGHGTLSWTPFLFRFTNMATPNSENPRIVASQKAVSGVVLRLTDLTI